MMISRRLSDVIVLIQNLIRREELGASLAETLVALALLGLVAAVFLAGLTISAKAVMVSQERVAAESLSRSQMEDTKAQAYVYGATTYPEIALPQVLADQGYDIMVVCESLHATDDGIQRITVTVNRNEDQKFTVVDYKVNR